MVRIITNGILVLRRKEVTMSSFGDGNRKTYIEEALYWIAREEYAENFSENKEAQRQFLLDTLAVLRYMCDEWSY